MPAIYFQGPPLDRLMGSGEPDGMADYDLRWAPRCRYSSHFGLLFIVARRPSSPYNLRSADLSSCRALKCRILKHRDDAQYLLYWLSRRMPREFSVSVTMILITGDCRRYRGRSPMRRADKLLRLCHFAERAPFR